MPGGGGDRLGRAGDGGASDGAGSRVGAGADGLDPSIAELLARPVDQVLKDLGLPPVPVAPAVAPDQRLPSVPRGVSDAPVVPGLDVGALVKPMTDLLSTFGSGDLGAGGVDPPRITD
ncbi:hypothetical protein P0W64_15355 [Tsukamurella sp. 8F]|uniref:hypothetical protein n=1 Tax=unclassified Tsukamurella TaxID=2633480 RepID=UPI0023BA1DDD|nr:MULTISPECIES: hypothetical protein [unclassified Tsukamurella]MDF0530900.1 hypothetical protein [Tsukamurella sp. 8J]MDF0588155.1 hypothetical protein [Tsukamurella sp. 8F]